MANKGKFSRLARASVVPVFIKKDVWQKKEEKLANYGPFTLT